MLCRSTKGKLIIHFLSLLGILAEFCNNEANEMVDKDDRGYWMPVDQIGNLARHFAPLIRKIL